MEAIQISQDYEKQDGKRITSVGGQILQNGLRGFNMDDTEYNWMNQPTSYRRINRCRKFKYFVQTIPYALQESVSGL